MNTKRYSITIAAATFTVAMALAGCGGGTTALSSGTSPTLPNQTLDANGRSITGAGPSSAATTQRTGVFVTGGAPVGYAHAWITLQKIEVLDTTEKATTVWENRDGLALDLATLKDSSGSLYALITSASVTSGKSQSRVRVTLGKALLLYTPGATVAQTVTLSDSLPRDDESRPVVSFALSKPRDLGTGKEDVVISFDPTKIVLNGGRAKLVAADGTKAAKVALADAARQMPGLFTGTVEDSASGEPAPAATPPVKHGKKALVDTAASPAPSPSSSASTPGVSPTPSASPKASPSPAPVAEATFTLKDENGQTVVVQLGKSVVVAGNTASPSPSPIPSDAKDAKDAKPATPAAASATPSAGTRVWVRGTLDKTTKRIIASEVVVLPVAVASKSDDGSDSTDTPDNTAALVGAATVGKGEGGSAFAISPRQVYGIVPSQSAVPVILSKDAVLQDRSGKTLSAEELGAALKKGEVLVEAAGAYDPIKGTLTAQRVTLDTGAPAPVPTPAVSPSPVATTAPITAALR